VQVKEKAGEGRLFVLPPRLVVLPCKFQALAPKLATTAAQAQLQTVRTLLEGDVSNRKLDDMFRESVGLLFEAATGGSCGPLLANGVVLCLLTLPTQYTLTLQPSPHNDRHDQ